LLAIPQGKIQLDRSRHRWEDVIEMYLGETESEVKDCIELDVYRVQ
jgi:hypothetical protein